MKKTRLLSLLLAVSLVTSSLPFAVTAAPSAASEKNESWSGAIDSEIGLVVEEALILKADPNNLPTQPDEKYILFDAAKLSAGTYKLSLRARNISGTNRLMIGFGGWYSGNTLINAAGAGNGSTLTVVSATVNGTAASRVQYNLLSNDWTTFESTFTVTANGTLGLGIADQRYAAVPGQVELDSFTLIKVDPTTGAEIENIGYSFTKTPISNNVSRPGIVPVTSYYSTKDTGATSLKYIGDSSERGPGLYTVSAKVRASKTAKLTASIELSSETVSATADIGTNWSDIELELDIQEAFTADKLTISISDGAVLDFDDIVFTQKSVYAFSDDWQGDNGARLPYTDIAEEYIYLAADPENMPEVDAAYCYDIAELPMGTYKVSFKIRKDPDASGANRIMIGLGGVNAVTSANSLINTNCTTATVISASRNGNSIADASRQYDAAITDEWETYELNFTSNGNYKLKLLFLYRDYPVNIKDVSIVNTETSDSIEYRFDRSGDTAYGVKQGTYVNYTDYYTIENSGTDTIVPKFEKEYAPGLYTLSGTVRSDTATVLAASIKGVAKTADIGSKFNSVNITFDMRESFSADQISITAPDLQFADFELRGTEYSFSDDYVATNNAIIVKNKGGEKYTYLSANPENMPEADGAYRYDIAELPAGTYKVSFKLRNDADATGANQIMVGLGDINQVTSQYALIRTDCTNATVISATLDGEDITSTWKQTTPVADVWQTFEFNFTSNGQYKLKLVFSNKECAVNIKELSIVNTETNETVDYGFDKSADTAYGGKLGTYVDLGFDYNTTAGSGVNSFKFKDDADLVPGLYTFTGIIRASADGTFSVDSGINSDAGINLASVPVSAAWKKFTLTLDLRETVKKSALVFAADVDYVEFSNIEVTAEPYTTLEDWEGTNGAAIVAVEESIPYYVARSSGDFEQEKNWNISLIPDSAHQLSTGNYRLSFDIRNDPSNGNAANKFEIKLGTAYSDGYLTYVGQRARGTENTLNVKSVTINGSNTNGSSAYSVAPEWTSYTIEFELNSLNVGEFRPNENGFLFLFDGDLLPINYRNFTLEYLDSKTTADAECFTHSGITLESATLDLYNYPGVDYLLTSRYTTMNSGADAITPVAGSDSDYILEPGVHHITGSFRAANGSAELSASLITSTGLKAESGSDSVTLDDTWQEVTFVIDSVVDINTTDIIISFTDDIEFKDIEITLVEKYYSAKDIDIGTVITLLLLKKEYAVDENSFNLIDDAIRKSVRKWEFGDQSLEFHRDDDGNYLRAGNIKDTSYGFTYHSGADILPGIYIFSGEFRTSNAGETGKIRMIAGGITKTISINNEWTSGEFIFEITKKQELIVKICSDAVAFYTQDFDFKNLSVISTDNIEGGYNLYPEGSLDTEGTHGWYAGLGEGYGKVVWNKEDNGNGYLSFIERGINYDEVSLSTLISLVPGAVYTISYDIRAHEDGDEFTVRGLANGTVLQVNNPSNQWGTEYDITHEWRRAVHTFTATDDSNLIFSIKGGQVAEDVAPFDFDNIVITRKPAPSDDNLYPAGTFNDEATALTGWHGGGGDATFTWNPGEKGDGYITVSDRAVNYISARIVIGELKAGKTYKVSYDIRTTNEGETLTARAYVNGNQPLYVSGASNKYGNEYLVTNEWRTLESTFTAGADGEFVFEIKGGQTEFDNKDFDIDNLLISIES